MPASVTAPFASLPFASLFFASLFFASIECTAFFGVYSGPQLHADPWRTSA
jgi:hypothetical protein